MQVFITALIIALLIVILVLFCKLRYKTHIIEDYETRLPRVYQDFFDTLNEIKAFLDMQERASRETLIRGCVNEAICRYSRFFRRGYTFDEALRLACNEYIKKEPNIDAGNENV